MQIINQIREKTRKLKFFKNQNDEDNGKLFSIPFEIVIANEEQKIISINSEV